MNTGIKKGSELELEIESLAFGAKGVAKVDGFVVFVPSTIPGQRVRALITRKRKGHAEARPLAVVRQSPDFVLPRCRHFEDCGGCATQDYAYEKQLAAKRRQVAEVLAHLGGFKDVEVYNTLPSPQQFFYRNKMEFTFSRQRWLTKHEIQSQAEVGDKSFALGLHARGRFDKSIDITECWLLSETSNRILDVVRQATKNHSLIPYSTHDHTGFWRFLVIREGKQTGELMVNVVTNAAPDGNAAVDELSSRLIGEVPGISTIVHNINRSKAQIAFGEEEHVLHGPGYLHDRIGSYTFRISANSFFQTNTLGAEQLYKTALDFAGLQGDEVVYDLYSGAGTISSFVSSHARRVIGFEIVQEAVKDAQVNCQINQVSNCEFVAGDLKDHLSPDSAIARWGKPDVVIADPPRAGLHPKVVKRLLELAPPRLVYVSCNPATFARDLKELCASQYRLEKIQPVDMFPHTAHCEVVGSLNRIG